MRKFLLSLFILSFLACKEEPNYIQEQFTGYWEIVNASRNGKITNTMSGAWIKIKGNEMMDNFFTSEVKYPFTIEGNSLIHLCEPKRIYNVKYVDQDSMVLSTKHLKYSFDFNLKKIAQ